MSASDAVLAGLYQAHAHELHRFARLRVGRQEAEDVVQDTYLRPGPPHEVIPCSISMSASFR